MSRTCDQPTSAPSMAVIQGKSFKAQVCSHTSGTYSYVCVCLWLIIICPQILFDPINRIISNYLTSNNQCSLKSQRHSSRVTHAFWQQLIALALWAFIVETDITVCSMDRINVASYFAHFCSAWFHLCLTVSIPVLIACIFDCPTKYSIISLPNSMFDSNFHKG